ncbi:MAG: hypothetical protein FD180_2255 [Planctomycetota bacterium]|nr:MAG: hypothetical protein FD180_2255 [Planctomycetota bacterium]
MRILIYAPTKELPSTGKLRGCLASRGYQSRISSRFEATDGVQRRIWRVRVLSPIESPRDSSSLSRDSAARCVEARFLRCLLVAEYVKSSALIHDLNLASLSNDQRDLCILCNVRMCLATSQKTPAVATFLKGFADCLLQFSGGASFEMGSASATFASRGAAVGGDPPACELLAPNIAAAIADDSDRRSLIEAIRAAPTVKTALRLIEMYGSMASMNSARSFVDEAFQSLVQFRGGELSAKDLVEFSRIRRKYGS